MNDCIEIKKKYNRIRGQIEGVGRMIDEKRDRLEIIQQISAVRNALSSLGVELLKEESNSCFVNNDKDNQIKKFEELVANFFKLN